MEQTPQVAWMRRLATVTLVGAIGLGGVAGCNANFDMPASPFNSGSQAETGESASTSYTAEQILGRLATLEVRGRDPRSGYDRGQFGDGWTEKGECDTRDLILIRDMTEEVVDQKCEVQSGVLDDPYTGRHINFIRGPKTSDEVQIDHVVSLSNAWQTGAQRLTKQRRVELANDPLNLLAVDGPTNNKKGDGDAATWLPPQRDEWCDYVGRQVLVKDNYGLWITPPEEKAMRRILGGCTGQVITLK